MAEHKYTHEYACEPRKLMEACGWRYGVNGVEYFKNIAGYWVRDAGRGWETPEKLKAMVQKHPADFPGFRVIREPSLVPYTDADVDRLVELQWAVWSKGSERPSIAQLERYAIDFLNDYAAHKAKK